MIGISFWNLFSPLRYSKFEWTSFFILDLIMKVRWNLIPISGCMWKFDSIDNGYPGLNGLINLMTLMTKPPQTFNWNILEYQWMNIMTPWAIFYILPLIDVFYHLTQMNLMTQMTKQPQTYDWNIFEKSMDEHYDTHDPIFTFWH